MYLILHIIRQPLLELLVQRRDFLDRAFLRGDLGDFVLKAPRFGSSPRAATLHDWETFPGHHVVDHLGLKIRHVSPCFPILRFWRCLLRTRSAVTHGTNGITNSVTGGSAKRVGGPAMLREFPNIISQLRSLILVRSFWLGLLAHNEIADFGMTSITERGLIDINLVNTLSTIMYFLEPEITS